MLITSLDNSKVKLIDKLKQKKYRDQEGLFIIETPNIIEEAYNNGYLKELYVLEGTASKYDVETYEVTKEVMNKVKQIETSKMLGICIKKDNDEIVGSKILLLDTIQDPGNLGTIIRSSLGFNIDTIVLSNTCCDLYNEKVLRATEGSMFKINIIRRDLKEVILKLKKENINIYGTDVSDGIAPDKIEKDNYAVIMGSEGNGLSDEIKELIDKNIYIKTNKNLESLNVAIATSIILYELDKE